VRVTGAPLPESIAVGGGGRLVRAGGTGGGWPVLRATATVVVEIAWGFGVERSLLFLGDRATEANVKSSPALRSARWVHFATHGFLDERRPERSGLVLAGADGSGEDGVLRVDEIFNLELSADLAVLSACDTGLGKRLSGEGLVGLTRAFLYAGAAAVVVSLWQVEDRSTAELMVQLKENLDRGDDHAEALRQAKLGLIAGGRFAEPRLWAPFILVGDRAAVAPAGSG
jgi:CHAT domain-containing protein